MKLGHSCSSFDCKSMHDLVRTMYNLYVGGMKFWFRCWKMCPGGVGGYDRGYLRSTFPGDCTSSPRHIRSTRRRCCLENQSPDFDHLYRTTIWSATIKWSVVSTIQDNRFLLINNSNKIKLQILCSIFMGR